MYAYVHIVTYGMYTYIYVLTRMRRYIHTYTRTHVHTYTHPYMSTYCRYIHTYIHACMHAYIHIYIHAPAHTRAHTHARTHAHSLDVDISVCEIQWTTVQKLRRYTARNNKFGLPLHLLYLIFRGQVCFLLGAGRVHCGLALVETRQSTNPGWECVYYI